MGDLTKLLRSGLILPLDERTKYIRALQNLKDIDPKLQVYAIAGLKDGTTTLDDLESILSGEHYNKWRSSIKEGLDVAIQNNLDGSPITANSKVAVRSDEARRELDEILDHIPIANDLAIDVRPSEVMYFKRNGEAFTYGRIPDAASNDRIMKVVQQFENNLPRKDREFLIDAINDTIEEMENRERHFGTIDKFVDALNTQLDDEERVRAVVMIARKISYK